MVNEFELTRRSFCQMLAALGISQGVIAPNELLNAFGGAHDEDVEYFFSRGISLFRNVQVTSIRPGDVEALLDEPVVLSPAIESGLRLTTQEGRQVKVRTCREYREALDNGYFARSQFDIKMESFLQIPEFILRCVAEARQPSATYVHELQFDNSVLRHLPASWACEWPDAKIPDTAHTVQDVIDSGHATLGVVSPRSGVVSWICQGLTTILTELMRADVNGDGIEDILAYEYSFVPDATFGAGACSILTRFGLDELVQRVDLVAS